MKRGFLALLLLAAGVPALAREAAVAPAVQSPYAPAAETAQVGVPADPLVVPAQPRRLAPFVASYAVYRDGKAMGDATLKLVRLDGDRWRVDMGIRGTRGLVGLVGLNLQQSTLFDVVDGRYRPLSQSTVRKALFGSRKTTGVYDWPQARAQWQGDVKKTRRDAVPLQPGDMSGLLINLAVIRDAVPGRTLRYRYVDNGRVRKHTYAVAEELEPISVGELRYNAMRVSRVEDANAQGDETVIWVASGVPTPIRMLQREDGEDTYDLRLTEYQGVQ